MSILHLLLASAMAFSLTTDLDALFSGIYASNDAPPGTPREPDPCARFHTWPDTKDQAI